MSLASSQNLEKTNDPIPKKSLERWKDGRADTLFHRTLPATAKGPTSTTAVDLQLKVKVTE